MLRAAIVFSCYVLFLVDAPVSADNITYRITPTTLDGWLLNYPDGDWGLAGGTITTDGTIGALAASNIIEYEISVSGPMPRRFTSTQTHRLDIGGVIATNTELQLLPVEWGTVNQFRVYESNPTEKCIDCERSVGWGQLMNGDPAFVYEIYDQTSNGVPDLSISGDLNSIAIATPEPAGSSIASISAIAFLGIIRRKRRR